MKSFFTEHWNYMAVFTGCKTELFDFVQLGCNTVSGLCKKMQMKPEPLNALLQSLVFQGFLSETENIFLLTKKGAQLTESHQHSYKYACMLWGDEHLSSWQNAEFTLKTGQPAFEKLYGMAFFNYLKQKPEKLNIYHRAMAEYARDDYQNIAQALDFSKHTKLTDIGGSTGSLLKLLASKYPKLQLRLAERPEVLNLIPNNQPFEKIPCDFFQKIPQGSDALILSRILHDWPDAKASQILSNCRKALPSGGSLYVIENFSDEIPDGAHLLTLNMRLMTGGFERSKQKYLELLKTNDFKQHTIVPLNELQNIIVCKK
jgi:hypothetical protein